MSNETYQSSVSDYIVAAFSLSQNHHGKLYERWIWMSHRIGSQLPHSLLSNSIQRLGQIDLLCRSMEMDMLAQPSRESGLDMRLSYMALLSDAWISSAHAICFTLKDRAILADADFLDLANDIRLVRVQNEKHELPSDKKLDEPLNFSPIQQDGKEPPIYPYDKGDRLRAHIPRTGISSRSSKMWEVFDPKIKAERWVERLKLSDWMLDLLSPRTSVN